MDNINGHKSNAQDQSLPLPQEPQAPNRSETAALAADLIRKKVQAAYADEPSATEEGLDLNLLGSGISHSKHQQFIFDLTNSGKSLADIQAAWHEYYSGLSDIEKHQVWQEFYSTHSQAASGISGPAMAPGAAEPDQSQSQALSLHDLKASLTKKARPAKKLKPAQHFQSLLFGLGVGTIVILIFMFSFFNERFIAPFIQPSRNVSGTPIISSNAAAGSAPQIIIPKINVEIPVVYGMTSTVEADVQKALENGVLHYADTALPGELGNSVIVGHSSNNILNRGKYKFAFVLLNRLQIKDIFYLEKDGKRYTYEVYKRTIVKPSEVSVLGPQDEPATASLITCDPPGTSTNRLVVVGKQISPDPGANLAQRSTNKLATSAAIVPSNAPSLWSRIFDVLSR